MVILWDLETGLSTVYPGHTAAVRDVEFNPDSSKLLASFPGHIDGVNALSWSPDGERLASGKMMEQSLFGIWR